MQKRTYKIEKLNLPNIINCVLRYKFRSFCTTSINVVTHYSNVTGMDQAMLVNKHFL